MIPHLLILRGTQVSQALMWEINSNNNVQFR